MPLLCCYSSAASIKSIWQSSWQQTVVILSFFSFSLYCYHVTLLWHNLRYLSSKHLVYYHNQNIFFHIYLFLFLTGSLQLRDQWARAKTSDVFSPQTTSLADGMFHHVQIHRDRRELDIQVRSSLTGSVLSHSSTTVLLLLLSLYVTYTIR